MADVTPAAETLRDLTFNTIENGVLSDQPVDDFGHNVFRTIVEQLGITEEAILALNGKPSWEKVHAVRLITDAAIALLELANHGK